MSEEECVRSFCAHCVMKSSITKGVMWCSQQNRHPHCFITAARRLCITPRAPQGCEEKSTSIQPVTRMFSRSGAECSKPSRNASETMRSGPGLPLAASAVVGGAPASPRCIITAIAPRRADTYSFSSFSSFSSPFPSSSSTSKPRVVVHLLLQPMEIYVDDETKLTLHGLVQVPNPQPKTLKLQPLKNFLTT